VTNGRLDEEITERLNAGKFCQLVRYILWKWKMPKTEKMCSLKITIGPILTYGAET
jgi:hypothetical protein